MTTDTSERGLERLICAALTGSPCDPGPGPSDIARERQWLADTVFSITYG
jgi:type I restriction enzyme R subunit